MAHPSERIFAHCFQIELELRGVWFCGGRKTREKPSKEGESQQTVQELITSSLQLPHIPVTAFSQTVLFLVLICFEFRFPQELQ